MEKNEKNKISQENAAKVSGGAKIKVRGMVDDSGEIVDEEKINRALELLNVPKDKVVISSGVAYSADTKSGLQSYDELSFSVRMPAEAFENSPYFAAFEEKLANYEKNN